VRRKAVAHFAVSRTVIAAVSPVSTAGQERERGGRERERERERERRRKRRGLNAAHAFFL